MRSSSTRCTPTHTGKVGAMSDTRLAQARDEAERQWPRKQSPGDPYPADRYRRMSMDRRIGFELGVLWADAHPYSTPEDLVAAYEEGQRDAVSKGMASPQPRTITRAEFEDAYTYWFGGFPSREKTFAFLLALGIEVVIDE